LKPHISTTILLYFTNPIKYIHEKILLDYDKMGQLRWLIDKIRVNCNQAWNIGKFCTVIDEMIIRYKFTSYLGKSHMNARA